MASSYTDLGIEKMASGENAGTWGTKTNTNLDIIEKSIAGYVEQAVTSGGTTALSITDGDATESTSVARHAVIKLTGTISGNSIVTVPDSVEKVYIVTNGTSGAYTVQFKTASGTGITFGVSEKTTKLLYSDGTNLVDAGFSGGGDLEGTELVLDADGDTTLTADTDDQIDIKIAGADDFQFTANTFTALSGSTIVAPTITASTAFVPDASDGAALGTSSLEFSDLFLADGAVVNFGDDQDVSLTHVADTGLLLSSGDQLQFGNAGENISGDGTDLTIAGNNINLTATADVVIPANVGITFGTGEKIEGDSTDLTVTSGADINLTATTDINIPANVGLTFGDDGEKIEGNGTLLTISSSQNLVLDAANDLKLDAGNGNIYIQDDGTIYGHISKSGTTDFQIKSYVSDKDFKILGNDGGSQITALTFDMSEAGAATFNSNVTVGGDLTVSGDDITMGTNTAGNLLVADGTNFNSIAAGSLSEISTVADDDVFIAVDTSGGGLKKIARSAIVSGLATSGAISNVADDSTPQLGGNLDMNGSDIVTTSNATIDLAPNGTGTVVVRGNTNSGRIVYNCESNSHGQTLASQPHSAAVTNTMLLPAGANSTLVSLVSEDTLTNKTLTSPKINEDVAVTSTATELNLLDGKAATNLALVGKIGGTNFTNSLLVGHATTGTLNSADENTAIGISSLDALTSGDGNVAVGYISGTSINSGVHNTIVGHSAGGALTSTSRNTFIGSSAGASSNSGDRNTCVGQFAGQNITSADGCVFIGSSMTADSVSDNRQLKIGGNDGSTTTTWISGNSDGDLTFAHDVILANDSFVQFGDAGENILGNGTDLTIASSNDLHLTATTDINIPANVGMTFGDDGEKIEGDGTNLTIASSNAITFNSSASTIQLDPNSVTVNVTGDITLDADGDQIKFKDGSTDIGQVDMTDDDLTITSLVSDKDTIFKGNDGGSTITALTLDMSAAGAATFNDKVIAEGGQLTTTGKSLVLDFN